MVIHRLGDRSFRLQSGDLSLLINPESNRLKADVVVRTLVSPEALSAGVNVLPSEEILFPGEYETKGIEVAGFPIRDDGEKSVKTAYLVRWEEMSIAVIGHMVKPPDVPTVEALNEPEILLLPVGGDDALRSDAAAKLVKQLEPNVIIPIMKKPAPEFLRALGEKAESHDKFVFKKKDIANEKGRVVLLEVQR